MSSFIGTATEQIAPTALISPFEAGRQTIGLTKTPEFDETFLGGAEKRAGDIQAAAMRQAAEEQRVGLEEFDPFRQAGLRALQQQEALTGTLGPEAQQQAFAALQESPGQRFLQQRQEQALLRNQAAIGGLGGGQVRTALQQQAMGFAQQDISSQLKRLAELRESGQSATQQRATVRAGVGERLVGAGAATASGILGRAAQQRAFEEQGQERVKEIAQSIVGGMSGGGGSFGGGGF